MSKLLESKSNTTVRISQTESSKPKTIPKGATILSKDTRIETEEIENGYLIIRTEDIRWKMKEEDSSEYSYITKKYYSKDDPLTVTTKDKALADLFEEENGE